MITKVKTHQLLLEQVGKIISASRDNFNPEYLGKILPIMIISENKFLFESKDKLKNLKHTNNLISQVITLSVSHNNTSVFLNYLKAYVQNTQFFLDKLQEGFPYESEFTESLEIYRKIIELIIKNDIINEDIINELNKIQMQYVLSKLIINYTESRRILSKFSKEEQQDISKINYDDIRRRNISNAELFDAIKALFRSFILKKREVYAELMIGYLRQSFFKEIRESNKAGLIEQLFEILISYIDICLEEKNHLANILFYTFRDILDKIYDPLHENLDDKCLINKEYLPIYKRYFLYGNNHLVSYKNDDFRMKTFENELRFFKDSHIFPDYKEIDKLLLSGLFFSIGCSCVEKSSFEYIDAIFSYSEIKPKDYVLVNEHPILDLEIKDLLLQLETTEYSSMDGDNVKSMFFLLSLVKKYAPTTKKEVKSIFNDFDPKKDVVLMRSFLLHRRNFETLLKRKDDLHNLFTSIKGINTKINSETVLSSFLEIAQDFETKIEQYDQKKELSKSKIISFFEHFSEEYNKRTRIYQICSTLDTKQKSKLLYNKLKEERIWFVEVSGTTAYASDDIGSQIGSNLAENEITILSQEISANIEKGDILSTKNFEEVLKRDIQMLTKDIIFLIPRNKYHLIRDFIRYDYTGGISREYLLINNKNIEIHDYIDRNNINSIFLFPKSSIKWKRYLFSYKPVENLDLELKDKPAEINFKSYSEVSDEDKKHITEKDIIILTKFGYNVKMDKDKIKKYSLEDTQ